MTAVADVAGFTLFAENRYVLIVGQGLEVISVTGRHTLFNTIVLLLFTM